MEMETYNGATKGFAAGEGARHILVSEVSTKIFDSVSPKAFDIEAGETEGKIKLVRCYYQIGSDFNVANETEEITPSAGNLCAVINTNTGEVTAVMDAVFNPSAPELFPLRLYVLDSDGNVTCDCRGSQVVVYA